LNHFSFRSYLPHALGSLAIATFVYGCSLEVPSVTKQQAPIADSQPVAQIGFDDPREPVPPSKPIIDPKLQQQRIHQAFSRSRPLDGGVDRSAVIRAVHSTMRQNGFSNMQIAAMLGNIEQESGLSPFAREPKSGSFGIMQWLGKRAYNLKRFEATYFDKNLDLDPRTFNGQLKAQVAFMAHESNGQYSAQYAGLKKMTTLRGATSYFRRHIEVSSDASANDERRVKAAKFHLEQISSLNS
jgi:hypothetical protein